MIHLMQIGNAFVHYSTIDAVFRTLDGKPISMDFHNYLGPFFSLYDGDGGWMPEEDTPEWDNLWRQFYGWWDAKGKDIYKNKG